MTLKFIKMKPIKDVEQVLKDLNITDPRIIPALKERWLDKEFLYWTTADMIDRIRSIYNIEVSVEFARSLLTETIDNAKDLAAGVT